MYQSPPPAFAWTRRHWLAVIGAGALGAAIAMAIIIVGGGVVSAGLRGIALGAVQVFVASLRLRSDMSRPQQPQRPINKPAAIFFVLLGVAAIAYLAWEDFSDGHLLGDSMSMTLAISGTIFGAYTVLGRYSRRVAPGR